MRWRWRCWPALVALVRSNGPNQSLKKHTEYLHWSGAMVLIRVSEPLYLIEVEMALLASSLFALVGSNGPNQGLRAALLD